MQGRKGRRGRKEERKEKKAQERKGGRRWGGRQEQKRKEKKRTEGISKRKEVTKETTKNLLSKHEGGGDKSIEQGRLKQTTQLFGGRHTHQKPWHFRPPPTWKWEYKTKEEGKR